MPASQSQQQRLYSVFDIKKNGASLPAATMKLVQDIRVEQNLHLPAQFIITFRDVGTGTGGSNLYFDLANGDVLPIGAEVTIAMGYQNNPQTVISGEVTAQELDVVDQATPLYIVRGYDRAHRLQRGRFTRTFLQVKDSDIASQLAGDAGLSAQTDATSVVYDYVLQNNQTDFEFLRERAKRIGYEVYVEDRKLCFVKSRSDHGKAKSVALWQDLLRLNMRMTSAAQVSDVKVYGWDPQQKQQIVGAPSGTVATSASGGGLKSGSQLASPFSMTPKMTVAGQMVQTQSEAEKLAMGGADDLAEGAVSLEAEAYGDAGLKPGIVLEITGLGQRFSGNYYVTAATHRYSAAKGAYTTTIMVSGRRNGTLLELMSGPARHDGYGHGVGAALCIGIVTNNKDPDKKQGRVKVKLPWLPKDINGQDQESDWARVVVPGGGNGRGVYFLPEVDDEVLVAFEHGDPRRAYVVGGLWNGKDAPPTGNDKILSGDGKVTQRIIKSRTGHIVTIDDSDDKSSISIVDSSGKNTFTIDTKNKKITISAEEDLELKAGKNIKMTAGQDFSLDAQQNCTIEATQDCSVKATNNATFKGMQVSVAGDSTCEVKGTASAKVSGAQVSVEGQAQTAIKGAIVQIN